MDTAVVTVRLFAAARAAAGSPELLVAPGSVAEICTDLRTRLPGRFAEVLAVSSLVSDGIRLDHAGQRVIGPGSVIDVLPPFAGG